MHRLLIAMMLLAGCGAPVPSSPTAPPLPPHIANLDNVACALPASRLGAPLRLAPRGRPFAELAGAPALLFVGSARARPLSEVYVDGPHVELAAFVDAQDLELHVQRRTVFRGYLVPTFAASLRLVSAERGALGVEFTHPDNPDLVVQPRTIGAKLPCDEVGSKQASNDWTEDDGDGGAPMLLIPGRPVTLSLEAGRLPAATIRARHALPVDVVARQGKWARVVIRDECKDIMTGWLEGSALRPDNRRLGTIRTCGGGAGSGYGEMGGRWRRCTHPVPLVASIDGTARTIGSVRAGTLFAAGEARGALVPIDLSLQVRLFSPASEPHLSTSAAALRDCAYPGRRELRRAFAARVR